MPPRYFGAIDQGTTSTRFLIFDRAGGVVACAQREHRQFYPQPGWVEHDPEEIWRNTQAVIAEARHGHRQRTSGRPGTMRPSTKNFSRPRKRAATSLSFDGATTKIMPMPRLNVRRISARGTGPSRSSTRKIGGHSQLAASI